MAALAQYVDFGQLRADEPATSVPGATSPQASSLPRGPGSLHKGMLLQEADALLGSPRSSSERKEGSLRVAERLLHAEWPSYRLVCGRGTDSLYHLVGVTRRPRLLR